MRNDLHVTGIWLKSFLAWKKKRPLIGTVCFHMLRTERSTWSSIAQEAIVSFVAHLRQRRLLQNRRVWGGVKLNIRVRGIHWEKGRINHTQMKGKQCNFIIKCLVVLFLHYFYFHCLKLLFNVLLVQVRKYGEVRKQGSKSVALCFGFYCAQVRFTRFFRRTTKNPVTYATS